MSSQWAPAPRRGCYDRSQPTEQRRHDQRQRLLGAAAALADQGAPPTVTDICRLAAVGRNSFYACFADATAALDTLVSEACERLHARLQAILRLPQPPFALLNHSCTTWLTFAADEGAIARVSLRHSPTQAHSPLGHVLQTHLTRVLTAAHHDGALPNLPDPLHVQALTSAAETLARAASQTPTRLSHLHRLLYSFVLPPPSTAPPPS